MATKPESMRNIPLIIVGVTIFILSTVLKGSAFGLSVGVILDLLQIAGIIVTLVGFGIKWTKKK